MFMIPPQYQVDLYDQLATAEPPINASWRAAYTERYEALRIMRDLALDYGE